MTRGICDLMIVLTDYHELLPVLAASAPISITETGEGEGGGRSATRLARATCCAVYVLGCLSSRSFVRAAGASLPGRAEAGTRGRAARGASSSRLPRTPSSPLPAACPLLSAEEGGAAGRCLGRGRR